MGLRFHVQAAAAAVVGCALFGSAAHAATVTFDTAGYTPGGLAGQGGSPTWADPNNAFVVAAGVGTGGTQALQTGTNAASGFTATYTPTAADYGAAFTPTSQLNYSFAIKAPNANQSAATIIRVFLGGTAINNAGSVAQLQFSTPANGSTFSVKGNSASISTETQPASINNNVPAFHTIAGVIDYATKTYTVNIDGGATTNIFAFLATTTPASFGSIFVAERSAVEAGTGYIVDDFQVAAAVPEPASLAALGLAGVLLVRRRSGR